MSFGSGSPPLHPTQPGLSGLGLRRRILVEEEGVEERTLAKVLKGPEQPTAAEIEQHEVQGHLPFKRWCPQCVSARGVGQQHRRVAHAEEELPAAHVDFAFFSSGVTDESEKTTMIVL
eukprot:2809772-Amphidinium_carterae.1